MWHLYTTPTESTQQVRDDVVFDLVLGEPGEHRQQPKHNGFELGGGAPGGEEEGRLQGMLASLGVGSLSSRSAHPVPRDAVEGELCLKRESPAIHPGHRCKPSTWESTRLGFKLSVLW